MAYITARGGYFCNFCRITPEAASAQAAPPAASPAPQAAFDIPPELAGSLPAAPASEATLYVPTSDPKPIVRRSSLRRGTVEALSEQETRQAVQTGDFIILSKPGRCALVAARKAFGDPVIEPLALEMPGEPWRLRLAAQGASVEVGLFKPRPPAPSRMAPYGAPPPEEFHVAYYALKGDPARLSGFITALLELLGEKPWSSRFWNGLSTALNQPQSKLMLDWKQYVDYAGARAAASEVASAQEAFRKAQRDNFTSLEAQNALGKARSALAAGEYDTAREVARGVGDELARARQEKERLDQARGKVVLAVAKIRALDPASREAASFDEQSTAISAGAPTSTAQSRDRMEALLQNAGRHLFALHAARANKVLSGISGEDSALVSEIRESLEGELAGGRRLLEDGDIEAADAALAAAVSSASQRIDGFLSENAQGAVGELNELFEGSKDNPALGAEFLVRLDRGRREVDAHMQGGHSREAGQLARALRNEIQDRLESSAPEIRLSIDGPRLTAETWNKVVMKIQNGGNADAANVVVAIDGAIEIRAQDELPLLKAGETYRDEIGIKCEENGSIPVKFTVDCERPHDSAPFHFEAELWLDFAKPLDLSGAKTITIDRSVHIVDSVLNRSTVGDDGGGGIPAVPEDAGRVEDGKTVIEDSVVNRSGGGKRSQLGATETKCPNCGRMISTEWKRCPYCN
jgi:hypothetical protein